MLQRVTTPTPPSTITDVVRWVERARYEAASTGRALAVATPNIEGSAVRVYVDPEGGVNIAIRPSPLRAAHRAEVACRATEGWNWHAPGREFRLQLGSRVTARRVAVWVRKASRTCSGLDQFDVAPFAHHRASEEFARQEATRQRQLKPLKEPNKPFVLQNNDKWIAFKKSPFR